MAPNQRTDIVYKLKFGMSNSVLPYVCDTNNFAIHFDSNKKKVHDFYIEVYNHFHEFSSQSKCFRK